MYSLWWRIRPCRASAIALSRVSAMCQESSTRQSLRSTVWPCFGGGLSAKPHCVGSALSPSSASEPIEMTPMPCLPASVMPDGLICEATANGMSSCSGRSCSAASCSVNQSLLWVTRSPLQQPADDADRLVLAVALRHRVDAERVRVGGQRARARAEDRPAAGHVVELHHALRDVERVVVGQRDDAGGELDALRRSPAAARNISGEAIISQPLE